MLDPKNMFGIHFTKTIGQILTVLGAAVILLLAVSTGVSSGKSQAISKVIAANAASVHKGLLFFHNDQDRFPSAIEYENAGPLLLNYFNAFPPAELSTQQCPQSFSYQRLTGQQFKLNFCLPSDWEGYSAGWNSLDQDAQLN